MGACDGADMSKKVMCCPGKIQVIILGGIFFLSALLFGGLFYWQIDEYNTLVEKYRAANPDPEQRKDDVDLKWTWCLMAVPGVMFLSAMCSFAMIKINPKLLLVVCTIWPICSSLVPAIGIWLVVLILSVQNAFSAFNTAKIYIVYVVAAGSVVYILCAIYCVVLLVCLGCCQRAGAGRDNYDLETENDDEDHESISESPIIFE
ncbi:hypothetical protein B9Z55_002994 [Caenorhabditis nigoni]|uniref:Transmembrane protein n=1 Tax=Caenorhabditis nigoni TaxID=1611254 RepID=A0A2G5VN36_9PELO|nr:hypothetical protein B9Z55_002994 [Caenorhabditis nigoni]